MQLFARLFFVKNQETLKQPSLMRTCLPTLSTKRDCT